MLAAALLAVFLVVGLFGRFPWKADEPYSFGIVWHMLQTGDWVVPQVADQPFVEKPPLVYWLGAIGARIWSGAQAHESSRLAVLLLVAVTLSSVASAAYRLAPEAARWRDAVLGQRRAVSQDAIPAGAARPHVWLALGLTTGTLGLVEQIHKFTADLGQMAGAALAVVGFVTIAQRNRDDGESISSRVAGCLLGTGLGVAFLSKGLLVPGIIVLTWLACLALPGFRTAQASSAARVAAAAAAPWLLVWPWLLFQRSRVLFDEWLWEHNLGRFIGTTQLGGNDVTWVERLASLALLTFPSGWLAAIAVGTSLWLGRRCTGSRWDARTAAPGHAALAAFLAIALAVLLVSGSFRANYILPILPVCVLLGLPAATLLAPSGRLRLEQGLNLAFALAFGVPIAVWCSLVTTGGLDVIPGASALFGRLFPLPFTLPFDTTALLLALAALLVWLSLVTSRRSRHPVTSWAAGVATLWVLIAVLLLPWIDAARSYREVFAAVGREVHDASCVATRGLGESELSMLSYVTGVPVTRQWLGHSGAGDPGRLNPAADACSWTLLLWRGDGAASPQVGAEWRQVWHGTRPANRDEHFALFQRAPAANPAPVVAGGAGSRGPE